jgi:predicted GNAT family N-acyltransferase
VNPNWLEQKLDSSLHNRANFRCGEPALDEYLQKQASQHVKKGVNSVYVIVDRAEPQTVLGYYSLSAAQLDTAELPESLQKSLPRYPVPCFRMGRLAASESLRKQQLGASLLACAITRCLAAKQQVAAFALIVDAKHEQAKSFYLHFGFTACRDSALTLFLPL